MHDESFKTVKHNLIRFTLARFWFEQSYDYQSGGCTPCTKPKPKHLPIIGDVVLLLKPRNTQFVYYTYLLILYDTASSCWSFVSHRIVGNETAVFAPFYGMIMSARRFCALLPIPLINSEPPRTLRMIFYGEKGRLYRYGADGEMNCATIPFLDKRLWCVVEIMTC